MDGDARGGAALSIRSVVDKPIKFIGTGEKMEAIDEFHPDRMAGRSWAWATLCHSWNVRRTIRRKGDTGVNKRSQKISSALMILDQIGQIKNMGNIKDLLAMIPGVGKAMKNMDIPDDAFKGIEAIIKSMTPDERKNPSIINGSRKQRIANGSGTNVPEVNKLMKQFEETRKMMKMMGDKSKMQAMMQRMQQAQGMRR